METHIAGQIATEAAKPDVTDARHDILFRTGRTRFLLARLLARCDEFSVTLTEFEIRWIDKQLTEIEAITAADQDQGARPQSEPAVARVRKVSGAGKRRFVDTILPNTAATDHAAQGDAPGPDGPTANSEVVMKGDQFIFSHHF